MVVEMRNSLIRVVPFVLYLIAATIVAGTLAIAENSPIGNWSGVVNQSNRNIVVTLRIKSLQIGNIGGSMRWGTPRVCSLQTEYSGIRDTRYTFNIAGTNGGWCDLYRDGSLSLEMDNTQRESLTFKLANKQGRGLIEGQLAADH